MARSSVRSAILCVLCCFFLPLATQAQTLGCRSANRNDGYGSLAGVAHLSSDERVGVPNLHFQVTSGRTRLAVESTSGSDGKFLIEKIPLRQVTVFGFGLFNGEHVSGKVELPPVLTECKDLEKSPRPPPRLTV